MKARCDRREFLRLSILGAGAASMGGFPFLSGGFEALAGERDAGAVTPEMVRLAAGRIKGRVARTPVVSGGMVSKHCGAELFLKLENQQYTGAFKERGALNKMLSLSPEERSRGVIAASAGNHSQGVALQATRLGIRSVIFMPEGAPNTKISRTRALGAEVVVKGEDFDHALALALEMAGEQGMTFIHPFDDPLVIAGQGTVGLEFLADAPELDALLVPVGGGGLISGCATAAKAINPKIRIYGVEAHGFPAMRQRLLGKPAEFALHTLADGLAVHKVGDITFSIVQKLVEDVFLVKEESIERAIMLLYEEKKIIAEGAGAVGLAALIERPEVFSGLRVGLVISGGNIDSRLFSNLLQRGLVRDGKLIRLRVVHPGSRDAYPRIAALLAEAGASIVEIRFDQVFHAASAQSPAYDLLLEVRDCEHSKALVDLFESEGMRASIIP